MRRFLVPLVGVVAVAASLVVVAPAVAVTSFGPQTPVFRATNCGGSFSGVSGGDAVTGPDGRTHGFVSVGCVDAASIDDQLRGSVITYLEGNGYGWSVVTSPYRGRVLGVAADTTGTYLLYLAADGVRITKRTTAGEFTAGHRLSAATGTPGALAPQGDVVAAGGRWWAVWSEQARQPDGEWANTELYQALTLGIGHYRDAPIWRQRIPGNTLRDDWPSLVLGPPNPVGPPQAYLAWERERVGETGYLMFAKADFSGRWVPRPLATIGSYNAAPDLAVSGPVTYLTWLRDGAVWEADNRTGAFTSTRLGVEPSTMPRVAASAGLVAVAFSGSLQPPPAPPHPWVYERSAGGWTRTDLTPAAPTFQTVLAVTSRAGRATVLWFSSGTLTVYARTQEPTAPAPTAVPTSPGTASTCVTLFADYPAGAAGYPTAWQAVAATVGSDLPLTGWTSSPDGTIWTRGATTLQLIHDTGG